MVKTREYSFWVLSIIVVSLLFSCNNKTSSYSETPGEPEKEEEWEECEACDGRGYFSHRCNVCNGDGRITTTTTQRETHTCPTCNGFKYIPCNNCGNYGFFTCPNCSGSRYAQCYSCKGSGSLGYIIVGGEYIKNTCGICKGKGYSSCDQCGGRGRITCNTCYGQGKRICPTCHGEGGPDRVVTLSEDAGPCPKCDGTGKTREDCEECEGTGKIKVE